MEHCNPSTEAPPPPPPSSHENNHQMAEQTDRDDQSEEEEAIIPRDTDLDLSTATSAISSPATSPRNLINLHNDILETIFLRVPAHQFPQIRATCKAVDAVLNGSIFIRRYIEEVVQRGEIIIPVRLRRESRVALYKNRYSKRVSWRLGYNLGSCYYRCYNTRKICLIEDEGESPTPIPCHGKLFCPWIECARWHRWFDGGFVLTFLRNRAPEYENSSERCPSANELCSVCSNTRPASCRSCMASLLFIKNPMTGIYRRLSFVDGGWTSKLKCIATYGKDHFRVLIAMPANAHDTLEHISFVKTMLYDSVIDSWREIINYSHYYLRNIRVVDTHGAYCRGAMYWLLEAAQSLIVFQVESERWEILRVRKPLPLRHPLGLVACMEQVLLVEAQDTVLIVWKLIERNSLDQSPNEQKEWLQINEQGESPKEQGEWLQISRSTEEFFRESEMAVHSTCSPNGDGFICFENLVDRTAVIYNVRTGTWGRSNDIHDV